MRKTNEEALSLKKGIDVSFAQGSINWGHVNADFAIIRAGYGREASQKDAQFENNYTGCKSNKIPVGCYWYSYALDEKEAREEARACLKVIKGKTFEYPVYFDIEQPEQFRLGSEKVSKICQAFCDELEKSGYWVGIYSYAHFLRNQLTERIRSRYAIWVAHTDVSKPGYSSEYGLWQYSHTGKMNGISGNVDFNYSYVDYPAEMKRAGLNGFKKTANKPEAAVHTVRSGENLTVIAQRYGTTVESIVKKNSIKEPDLIYPGQKLKI